MSRDHLILHVNGGRHQIRGEQAFATLSDFLRRDLRLVGTKVVCAEGDCGACSVLLGRAEGGEVRYRAVDSCILFLHQLDLCHVITVEGLTPREGLHPLQESMVEHFGSQCGFCTPGFVMAMAATFENAHRRGEAPGRQRLVRELTGNLCRCTGYVQILEAAEAVDPAKVPAIAQLYPDPPLLEDVACCGDDSVTVDGANGSPALFLPASLDEAIAWRKLHPEGRIVAGATDLGVQHNQGRLDPRDTMVLSSRLAELAEVGVEEGVLLLGALATWERVLDSVRSHQPQLADILDLFGAAQIRSLATVGGNLVNASPIADSLPFFYVVEAELEIAGPSGGRRLPVESFYRGYKDVALESDELLVKVIASLPTSDERLRLYKISRRRDLDISTFTAAVLLRLDDGHIARARVAYGGVGPVVLRLRQTEAALEGQAFSEETFRRAGLVAREEVTPISDVRGSEENRRQLAERILLRTFFDLAEEPEPVGARSQGKWQ